VYLALEKPADALPVLERALKIEPESSGLVWVDIGRAYRLENRADEAVKAFEQAITLGQRKASVYYQLAVAAKKSGNLTRSREALEMSQRLRHEEQIAGPAGPQ
jgi:tetratricopeptide (TPR) repeat protein